MGAKNGCLHGPIRAVEVEAMSCREALSWLKDKGNRKIIIERDCQVVRLISPFLLKIVKNCWKAYQEVPSPLFISQRIVVLIYLCEKQFLCLIKG